VLAINMRANVPKPGGWAPSRGYARAIVDAVGAGTDRLVVCFTSFAGADLDQEVVGPLAEAGVPYLESTETAMLALRHAREHRLFLERPAPAAVLGSSRGTHGAAPDRHPLDNTEAMRLLSEFGIPLAETVAARDADEAVEAARGLGYPVVLKIDSPDIAHKTEVGGVRVGCGDATAVRAAADEILAAVRRRAPRARIAGLLVQRMIAGGTEMIVGIKSDPLFGPAVVCGFGGIFVEVLRDVAVRVPPLDAATAHEMIAELRGSALLKGARGRPPADVAALADILIRLASLAEAYRDRLGALDINPLLVLEEGHGVMAVDWLVESPSGRGSCLYFRPMDLRTFDATRSSG
jgi:acyl-CoA synthetase (NDP forming)